MYFSKHYDSKREFRDVSYLSSVIFLYYAVHFHLMNSDSGMYINTANFSHYKSDRNLGQNP